jgi:flagellar biosynthesis protein FlhF
MTEALAAAKRDLGADAVILETRTFRRSALMGLRRRTICELTASSSDRAEIAAGPRRRAERAQAAYARAASAGPGDLVRTRRLAQAIAESHERRARGTPPAAPPPAPVTAPVALQPAPEAVPPPAGAMVPRAEHSVARRFILTAAGAPAAAMAPAAAIGAEEPPGALGPETGASAMQQELEAIRAMVGQVLERQAGSRRAAAPAMPGALFEMYLELLGQDLSEELADRIVSAVRGELSASELDDRDALRQRVLVQLASLVPAADPVIPRRSPDDRPLTIAMIGPTGVGKTTTLAKLAASFKLRDQKNVGLVTCDTYRIAAVDQLRTYANIIGLQLEVALSAAEMSRAVQTLRDCDVVLIDTAGRSPGDQTRLEELRRCLSAARPHEVHLVLSSTSSQRVLLQEAAAFADVGADRIVLTKLDEAVSFGVLINVMQAVGKSLSFITTGQEVPDHIEVGRPRRLAELVLGAELHG